MATIQSALQKREDGTIQLTITIPAETVKKTAEEVMEKTTKEANIAGFRKGKAPKKLVENAVDQQKMQEEVLKKLLPQAYTQAVTDHAIRPIINPKIHVEKLEEGKDWVFTAMTCEIPDIQLGDYKDNVKKITAKSKIVIPGKEQKEPNFDEIMKAILDSVKVKIPKILIDEEVNRLLSQTLDEIKRLGLTLEQYLASTNKTADGLRQEYAQKAESDVKLEFTLQAIGNAEKIAVDEKEVNEAIQKAKDPNERQNMETNRYLLTSILRQQKTLDFLKNL